MSTYLQLCTQANREFSGGTGPSAVTGQTGNLLRLVNWVADSWSDIQRWYPNWRWMRSTWQVSATSGDDTYAGTDCTDTRLSAAVTRFSRWIPFDDSGYANVKSYLSSSGVGTEGWLVYLPWSDFRARYKFGTQNNGPPANFTIDPQNNLILGPKPDNTYIVSGEYQMSKQTLSADGDTPEMPSDYHDLIVYWAMVKFAATRVAPEVLARARLEGTRIRRALELNQLPAIAIGAPMA